MLLIWWYNTVEYLLQLLVSYSIGHKYTELLMNLIVIHLQMSAYHS